MLKSVKVTMVIAIFLLVSVFGSLSVAAQDTTLTVATINTESSHLGQTLAEFVKRVEEKTDNVDIRFYPGGQLGDASSLYQSVIDGDIDIIMSDPGWFAEQHPEFNILEANYIFNGEEHFKDVLNTPGQLKYFEDKLVEDPGLKTLLYTGGMERNIISTFPINSIDDLKGKTMRSKSVSTNIEWWKALGANPVPVAFQEVYTAVQTGVVSGSQNSLDAMLEMRFVEVNDYVARTQQYLQVSLVVMNNERFETLDEETQNILLETGMEVQKEYFDKAFAGSEEKLQTMQDEFGIEVTYPDKEPFIKVSREQLWNMAEEYGITETIEETFKIEKQ